MVRLETMRLAQLLLLGVSGALGALTVDIENQDSIKEAASLVAKDLMTFYKGEEEGEPRGILPGPPPFGDYYWWTGAVFWSALIDYRNRSGDETYDDTISRGILWQIGSDADFMPTNYTADMGNDDQALWGLSASLAAITGFEDPDVADPQWVPLAKAVFEEQTSEDRRVDDGDCEGALRWQIYPINVGYKYISSSSNIAYFNLGSQLAYLTDNKTISKLAEDTYDLLSDVGFIDEKFNVYDGAYAVTCNEINKLQFSYNAAMLLEGCAYQYKYTADDDWKERIDGLLARTLEVFFPDGVAVEAACEKAEKCSTNMEFYKGVTHRALATTMRLAPHTADTILPVLKSSAKAAAEHCTGGDNGRMCGFSWIAEEFDSSSAGAQTGVLSALVSVMTATEGSSTGGNDSTNSGNNSTTTDDTSTPDGDTDTPGSMGARTGINFGVTVAGLVFGALASL